MGASSRSIFNDINLNIEFGLIDIIHFATHDIGTVYPKKYAHGFVVLCFVVVMQSFIMNSHEVFIHIHQGCFVGTGAIVRLPQCQWSKPDGYGKTSQYITTTKHSKAKTVCIFLGIYCMVGCDCYTSENNNEIDITRMGQSQQGVFIWDDHWPLALVAIELFSINYTFSTWMFSWTFIN